MINSDAEAHHRRMLTHPSSFRESRKRENEVEESGVERIRFVGVRRGLTHYTVTTLCPISDLAFQFVGKCGPTIWEKRRTLLGSQPIVVRSTYD